MKSTRQGGRPRSEDTKRAILSAAYSLMKEKGFRNVTMDNIAAKASASKATLYRWWTSKAHLLLEAVHDQPERYPLFHNSGSAFDDILEEVNGVIEFYSTSAGGAMLDLVVESRHDDELAAAIREKFVSGRRADTQEVFMRGVATRQADKETDFEVLIDAIWGAIYYRLLVYTKPLPEDYAERLIKAIWPAVKSREQTD